MSKWQIFENLESLFLKVLFFFFAWAHTHSESSCWGSCKMESFFCGAEQECETKCFDIAAEKCIVCFLLLTQHSLIALLRWCTSAICNLVLWKVCEIAMWIAWFLTQCRFELWTSTLHLVACVFDGAPEKGWHQKNLCRSLLDRFWTIGNWQKVSDWAQLRVHERTLGFQPNSMPAPGSTREPFSLHVCKQKELHLCDKGCHQEIFH